MISIIVCHRNPTFLDQLKQSISNTIGVAYEMIVIDNTTNKYNIFQAYNQGIKQSKYDLVCFVHEDIIFHTKDWGKIVIEHFKNPKVGIIGVVGSHYVPKLPGSHWSSGIISYNIIHTIGGKRKFESGRYIDNKELSMQAILLDGLWLCISKTVKNKVIFDETTFSGFHCYDSDICLQVKKLNYDVKIVFDINIEHFSLGNHNRTLLKNIFSLYNKWERELPMCAIKLTKTEISHANFLNAYELFEQIRINKFGLLYTLITWLYYLRCNPPTTKMNCIFILRLLNERFFLLLKRMCHLLR